VRKGGGAGEYFGSTAPWVEEAGKEVAAGAVPDGGAR
jgi:hypothetical protein